MPVAHKEESPPLRRNPPAEGGASRWAA